MQTRDLTQWDSIWSVVRTAHVVSAFAEIVRWTIPNNVRAFLRSGIAPIMKLYTTGTTDISVLSEIMVGYRKMGETGWHEAILKPYRPWATLTLALQQDSSNKARIVLDFPQGGYVLTENMQLGILLKTPVVMEDWSSSSFSGNSNITFPIDWESIV